MEREGEKGRGDKLEKKEKTSYTFFAIRKLIVLHKYDGGYC